MKVAGDYSLPAPPERAYALLQDPAVLAKCIPGCEGLDRVGQDDYAMRLKVGIAAVSGRFDGKVRIADQKPPTSFRLIVEGSGKVGFMKGDGTIALLPVDGGSNVQFEGEVQVGGTIANVGQRLIQGSAKMIINRFFDKLAEEASAVSHA
jgi:carbon monoxide dehydrogenase subunit G